MQPPCKREVSLGSKNIYISLPISAEIVSGQIFDHIPMAVQQDLEKAGGTVNVVPGPGDAHGDVDAIHAAQGPQETPPDNPDNAKKLQIDRDVAEVVQRIKHDSERFSFRTDARGVLPEIYERNLNVCTAVLVKDYIRTREDSSVERWEVLQGSLRRHGECRPIRAGIGQDEY